MFKDSEKDSALDVFLNLLSLLSLAALSISLNNLLAKLIDQWISFEHYRQGSYYYTGDNLNYPIATLSIAAPLFIVLLFVTNNRFRKQPELKKTGSKHAVNFLTLLASSVLGLSYLVYALWQALNGNVTVNLLLKLLVALLISAAVFAYYLRETKDEKSIPNRKKLLIASVVISFITVLALIAGVAVKLTSTAKVNASRRSATLTAAPTPYSTSKPVDKQIVQELEVAPQEIVSADDVDYSVTDAVVYRIGDKLILELKVLFEGNDDCPSSGLAICVVNPYGINAVDGDGFKLSRILNSNVINSEDLVQSATLLRGEKIAGKYYFEVDDITDTYSTYYGVEGYYSEKIELQMEDVGSFGQMEL